MKKQYDFFLKESGGQHGLGKETGFAGLLLKKGGRKLLSFWKRSNRSTWHYFLECNRERESLPSCFYSSPTPGSRADSWGEVFTFGLGLTRRLVVLNGFFSSPWGKRKSLNKINVKKIIYFVHIIKFLIFLTIRHLGVLVPRPGMEPMATAVKAQP